MRNPHVIWLFHWFWWIWFMLMHWWKNILHLIYHSCEYWVPMFILEGLAFEANFDLINIDLKFGGSLNGNTGGWVNTFLRFGSSFIYLTSFDAHAQYLALALTKKVVLWELAPLQVNSRLLFTSHDTLAFIDRVPSFNS